MVYSEELVNLLKETSIVVDNAKRPLHSSTDSAPQYPLLRPLSKPSCREKRMRRSRSKQSFSRWESMPSKELSLCRIGSTEFSSSHHNDSLTLVNLPAMMPLRMPVRSSDENDSQLRMSHSSVIEFLDEALALGECCLSHGIIS
jgi:hypothetical protein